MNPGFQQAPTRSPIRRERLWFGAIAVIFAVFAVRSFYLQIIRYDYYKKAAMSDQLKEYVIPAARGVISAHEGGTVVPLVLNQKLYTLYADPSLVKNADTAAAKITGVIGGQESDVAKMLRTPKTRYVVLHKQITPEQSKAILAFKLPGIGTQEQNYRTYPQGTTAAQLLGFVNDSGSGEYGVEQALNNELKGTPGQLKAVTDINGVPLAASGDNVSTQPVAGDNVVLTVDLGMQAQMEQILAREAATLKTKELSALIMDPNTGAVKAMANYPSYDPANYQKVTDPAVFQNAVASNAIEPGSTMKTLTVAAALDQGIVTPETTFYDPAHWLIDGFNITDIEEDGGPGTQSIASTLNLSLNTGATWLLMQMGGGQINSKARNAWYDYMTNHFLLDQATGIEQGYESAGYIPSPKNNGAGIDLTYANTSFGQAVQITALQMGAAVSSVLNGGTHYQPYLVSQVTAPDGGGKVTTKQPKVLKTDVVSPQVSDDMMPLLEYVVKEHYQAGYSYLNFGSNYSVGGKTGTAQVAKPGGGYYDDEFNGTYAGFVGGDKPQYVIVVYAILPQVHGYAGSMAGQPVFADLAHMLIDDFGVTPKSH